MFQEREKTGPEPFSIQELVFLRAQVPEILNRPDLDYSLTLTGDGLLQVVGGPQQIVDYIRFINGPTQLAGLTDMASSYPPLLDLSKPKMTPITSFTDKPTPSHMDMSDPQSARKHPFLARPTADELKGILVDFPNAALHISVVQKMLELMKGDELDERSKRLVAIHALKTGSPIVRFYELQVITEVEDAAFQILWPEEYNVAKILRQKSLFLQEEPTAEWLQLVSDELKKDFLVATDIPGNDLIFSLRLKGLLSYYLKYLEGRNLADTLAFTASISDEKLEYRALSHDYASAVDKTLEERKGFELTLMCGFLRRHFQQRFYKSTGSRNSIVKDLDPKFGLDGYKAYHFNLDIVLEDGTNFICEARVDSWSQQLENMLRHVGYKGIQPSTGLDSYHDTDPLVPGMIARRNLVNSLQLVNTSN